MNPHSPMTPVTVYVDPQCPFAWITYRWLREAERQELLQLRVELMSLACVNEHEALDPDYRAYNDDAWAAARVAAALLASGDADRWPAFYATYGHRRHVDGLRDNRVNIAASLAGLELPSSLAEAGQDEAWDDDLRRRTRAAVAGVDSPGGTPITWVNGKGYFGPVLTSVPEPSQAAQLWEALRTLSAVEAFASVGTRRSEHLDTGR